MMKMQSFVNHAVIGYDKDWFLDKGYIDLGFIYNTDRGTFPMSEQDV